MGSLLLSGCVEGNGHGRDVAVNVTIFPLLLISPVLYNAGPYTTQCYLHYLTDHDRI